MTQRHCVSSLSRDMLNHELPSLSPVSICWILNARPESNKVSVNKFPLQINSIASFWFDESNTSRYISLNILTFIILFCTSCGVSSFHQFLLHKNYCGKGGGETLYFLFCQVWNNLGIKDFHTDNSMNSKILIRS